MFAIRITKFVLFLLLFDKTQPERFTIGECNATKDFKNSFSFFLTYASYVIAIISPTKATFILKY